MRFLEAHEFMVQDGILLEYILQNCEYRIVKLRERDILEKFIGEEDVVSIVKTGLVSKFIYSSKKKCFHSFINKQEFIINNEGEEEFTLTAVVDTEIVLLNKSELFDFLDDKKFLANFLFDGSKTMQRDMNFLAELSALSVKERIIYFLNKTDKVNVVLKNKKLVALLSVLTIQQISEFCSCSSKYTINVIKEGEKLGILNKEGRTLQMIESY